ncbi:uncharacterized protein LOC113228077 [Hyposmocoma kahamanoa]|uniref:uncharacterized protein LOC113228077 n=1 Tax=Hyposmocoma kahamanoa TaxID=1477025 RepID=UPI000E6D85DB|nr:uncharacterized protein LOC113228077 [Hyposmocoma kahamanoa]
MDTTLKEEHKLLVVDRKIFRKILGTIKGEFGNWRAKFNREIEELVSATYGSSSSGSSKISLEDEVAKDLKKLVRMVGIGTDRQKWRILVSEAKFHFGSLNQRRDVHQSAGRINRGTPTFKSPAVGIARDFGKRTPEQVEEQEQIGYEAPFRREFNPRSKLLVAQNFGKRSDDEECIRKRRGTFKPNSNILIARGYGKRADSDEVLGMDNFWETLESSPEGLNGEKTLESIPVDWFVNEMLNNPDFARSVVRKFVDLNQDGLLSAEELLRNVV